MNHKFQAFSRKRVVKVSSPPSKNLGVADTRWQLEEILDKAGVDAHPDFHVEESKFQLPTMLITPVVMNRVHKAINEHRKTDLPISKCIRLKDMDQHMPGLMNVSVYKAYCLFCFGRTQTFVFICCFSFRPPLLYLC